MTPTTEAELSDAIRSARAPLAVSGGGTRVAVAGDPLSTLGLAGITTYEPAALTLIARAGTPVAEIEAALAAENQMLAFEPADHRAALGTNGTPTIGGVVAANVSGPRRLRAGACRDHLLGLRFVDGHGRILKNGGRVMKNVTGLDLGKLLCGSHGTLAVISEVALKVLPVPETTLTLALPATVGEAAAIFARVLATPYEVSGATWRNGTLWLRIEGLERQVAYRRDRLAALLPQPPEVVGNDIWRRIRDMEDFVGTQPLWRIAVRPSQAAAVVEALGGQAMLDWGGGLILWQGDTPPEALRASLPAGAHATLVRRGGWPAAAAFHPEPPVLRRISAQLRRSFDPRGILNSGLME